MNIGQQIVNFRFYKSGLVKRFKSPQECADRLVGVQAQILPSAGLAIFNRIEEYTLGSFKNDMFSNRNMVKLWGQRTTLHIYTLNDWQIICGANLNKNSWWSKKVEKIYGDKTKYIETIQLIERHAKRVGEFSRSSIKDLVVNEEFLISSWGGIFIDIVGRGSICHAGQKNGKRYFAHREYWKTNLEWKLTDEVDAKRKILNRFLTNYAPATLKDFSYWSGLTMTETRQIYQDIKKDFFEIVYKEKIYMINNKEEDLFNSPIEKKDLIILSRFDPILLAYQDKSWLIDIDNYKKVWRVAGHIEGTIIKDYRIIGVWKYKLKSKSIIFNINMFQNSNIDDRCKIEKKLQSVAGFFDKSDFMFEYE